MDVAGQAAKQLGFLFIYFIRHHRFPAVRQATTLDVDLAMGMRGEIHDCLTKGNFSISEILSPSKTHVITPKPRASIMARESDAS